MRWLLFIFLITIPFWGFSQSMSRSQMRANELLKTGDYSNEVLSELFKLSLELDRPEREYLYYTHTLPVALPVTLNTILGFGIGSFSQNDDLWGGAFAIVDIIGTGTVLTSFGVLAVYALWIPIEALSGSDTPEYVGVAESALIYSLAALGISRVFQIVRPIYFGYRTNKKLWEALHLDIELGPTISPSNRVSFNLTGTIRL